MARVTIEDCLDTVENRFALCLLAAKRARMLLEEDNKPLVETNNRETVTALREIAAGKVGFKRDLREILGLGPQQGRS